MIGHLQSALFAAPLPCSFVEEHTGVHFALPHVVSFDFHLLFAWKCGNEAVCSCFGAICCTWQLKDAYLFACMKRNWQQLPGQLLDRLMLRLQDQNIYHDHFVYSENCHCMHYHLIFFFLFTTKISKLFFYSLSFNAVYKSHLLKIKMHAVKQKKCG